MRTETVNFKLWVGDTVYYIDKDKIVSSYVYKVYSEIIATCQPKYSVSTTYILQNGIELHNKDIDTIYFTDKKKLIHHYESQL